MKSQRIQGYISVGSFTIVLGGGVLVLQLWPYVATNLQNTFHAVSYACQDVWQNITRNQVTYSIVGGTLLVLFGTWCAYVVYRAVRMSRRVQYVAAPIPVRVLSLAVDAGLDPNRLTIFADARAFAMTIGLRRPEVFISTSALRTLSVAQLGAVLEHEAHHVRQREPLRRFFLALALYCVPAASLRRQLRASYVAASEVEADEQVRDQRVLGSAVLQLVTPPIAAPGFSPLDARVERLVNPTFQPSGSFALKFVVSVVVVVAGISMFVPRSIAAVFGGHPSARTAEHLTICSEEHERMLQSQSCSCGPLSTARSCETSN